MRAFPLIAACGFLTTVTAQAGRGDPTDPATPPLVEIMHGAGVAPDTYIWSRAASMGLDSFAISLTQPCRLAAATALSNTPGAAPDVIALIAEFDDREEKELKIWNYTVVLSGPIPVYEWTRIELIVEPDLGSAGLDGQSVAQIVVSLAHLPCDLDQDGQVTLFDAMAFGKAFEAGRRSRRRSRSVADVNGDERVDTLDEEAAVEALQNCGLSLPVPPVDCNRNGLNDAFDVDKGDSKDANGDGVPDECVRIRRR